jgi:RND family efflux transporter MFP subunit
MKPTARPFHRRFAIGTAALLAATAAIVVACGGGEPPPAAPAGKPVRVAEVVQAPVQTGLRAVGTLAPADEIRLSFKTGGVIASISVEQGEAIRSGQELAALAQEEIAAAVSQARALAEKAERDLERGRALYADEVATREQLEDLETARDIALASLRTAEFNARFSRIEAPADGVVLRKLAERDELVSPGQPVLVVGDTSGGWVVSAALSDRDVVRVLEGDVAEVTLDAYPGRTFSAKVVEMASAADPMTGTYEVKLSINAGDLRLVQGLVAKVEMVGASGSSVPVVPVHALLEADGSEAVVYVVARREADEVARRVAVRVGRLVGDRVEIVSGLEGGERLVTEGAPYLRDGDTVRIVGTG